jgi:cytosine/adenosine deaminase-related metal-dependent hydrolase
MPALESAARMAEETGAPMHMHLLETPYQKPNTRAGAPAGRLWPTSTASALSGRS